MAQSVKNKALRAAAAVLLIAIFWTMLPGRFASAHGGRDQKNKKLVVDFYTTLFEKHLVREAFERYVGKDYIQHNPLIPDGIEPDIKFLTERFKEHPQATNEIKRAVAENDLVVLHVHSRLSPDDRGRAIIDIFRVYQGKIVEHWDVIQPVPEKSANNNTMF